MQTQLDNEKEIRRLRAQISEQKSEIEELKRLLAYLQRKPYVTSSEKYSGMELLFNEPEEEIVSADRQEKEESNRQKIMGYDRAKPVRRPLPENLPREVIRYELSEEEKLCSCGGALHEISPERTEQLHIIPAKMIVRVHERMSYGCRSCESGVKLAPMPKQPIPKAIPSAATLSHIAVSKYADALPLYRQEQMWRRAGIDLSRGSMANWMTKIAELSEPILNLMREDMLKDGVVHCDETTVKVMEVRGVKGLKTLPPGYMWVMSRAGPGPISHIYEYDPSRSGRVIERLLSGFSGTVVTDGFDGYNRLKKMGIQRAGCWAHARRKFVEAIEIEGKESRSTVAHRMLTLIRRLYRVERYSKDKTPEDRLEIRRQTSRKVMNAIEILLNKMLVSVPPKTPTGKALSYLSNEWPALQVFFLDGRVPIDNNRVENAIRPFTLGRKNWLFSATESGAKASAAIYSLIETAKANGLDPSGYLERILTALPNATTLQDIERLLPYPISN